MPLGATQTGGHGFEASEAPPLADRDFLLHHTVLRHESGRGLMRLGGGMPPVCECEVL